MTKPLQLLMIVAVLAATSVAQDTNITVTLKHGGQLLGKKLKLQNVDLDVFLNVPYGKPPVGALRFQKPEKAEPWIGVKDARAANGNMCVQKSIVPINGSFQLTGVEDCLNLDITVPGGVRKGAKKAVMMWIHGGGYTSGSKNNFIGAGLAARGDVIVVAISYRLGPFGFLSEGSGSGNFGLWDMRQALLWIQENIAEFGGDPDMVTIFGESAGGGAVSALVMSRYTEGLFKRAIQQSGTLYTEWGWYLSVNERKSINEATKRKLNCSMDVSIYSCLANLDTKDLSDAFKNYPVEANPFHPTPDDDFFPDDISSENYNLSKRFDSMIGFNTDEGNLFYQLGLASQLGDKTLQNGISREMMEKDLRRIRCQSLTKMSVDLCVEYITNLYGLDKITDSKERALALIQFYTDMMFSAESLRQLLAHSQTSKRATYAYYFTQQFDGAVIPQLVQPAWLANHTADHADEIIFVLGGYYIKDSSVWGEYYSGQAGKYMEAMAKKTTEADKELTDVIITAWTNFAKSGNPNQPVSLPANTPQWPQFNSASDAFIELNGQSRQVITTPNKERLESLISTLFSARQQQKAADAPQMVVLEECPVPEAVVEQTTVKNSSSRALISSLLTAMLLTCMWL